MSAKYKTMSKMTKKDQDRLFAKLAKTISLLKTPEEVAYFLKDLLTEAEVFMLARRLQVAELIVGGANYDFIRKELKVSDNTIANVQAWLNISGDGYRTVIKRLKNSDEPDEDFSRPFNQLKRRYPMYYWPELLLKEIVKNANKKERQRLTKVVNQLKEKTTLTTELKKILNS